MISGRLLDESYSIAVDNSGNSYVTGIFTGSADIGDTILIARGATDIFLVKYDSSGQLIWVKGAGSGGEDGANDVTTDSQGNIYVCGYIGGISEFDDLQVVGGGFFVAKYDPNGLILWVKQNSETTDLGKSLALIPSGDLLTTGVFENSATFGSTVLNGNGQSDVFVTRLDTVTISSLEDHSISVPHESFLAQNYPNPFNLITTINYQLSATYDVELRINNLLGQEVAKLVSEKQPAGSHQVQWNAGDISSSVYYYKLVAGKYTEVRKMILLR